jgi:hypothetical protein
MYALEADFEAYGVWGGTTTLERRVARDQDRDWRLRTRQGSGRDQDPETWRLHARHSRAKEFVDLFEGTFAKRMELWRSKAEAHETEVAQRPKKRPAGRRKRKRV